MNTVSDNTLSVSQIVDLASAFYGSAALFAAIDCGVFDAIEQSGGTAGISQIASNTGASQRGLTLLMDALVAIGLLQKDNELYSNTPAGKITLVAGATADLTKAIRYNRDVYPAWGRLKDFVASGAPVERPEIHLGDDPARTHAFAMSMRGRAMAIGQGVVPMLDLTNCSRLLDLAGGPGAYAELIARANPKLSIVTVDVPAISDVAAECVRADGLADRIECRRGDYHTDEYEANTYDAVTIFGALHQESPQQIVDILRRAARALKSGGRIFVLDMMTDCTHTAPKFSALFGLNMALTTTNGWVFSDSDLREWMREAGFNPNPNTQLAPPPMPHWLVWGQKI